MTIIDSEKLREIPSVQITRVPYFTKALLQTIKLNYAIIQDFTMKQLILSNKGINNASINKKIY